MHDTARQTRENRTITVDFQNEATYFQLLDDGKAFVELVLAFLLSIRFQLRHKEPCRGDGCLTRHSHYRRVRLGGLTIWRLQCTTGKAVFTVLPHFVLRYRQMHPEVARDALLAMQGGRSLERCAVICHISPMALYRLVCALGHHSVVTVLTRCGLPLPVYFLADEKHSRCLTEKVYLPTIVRGRVIWHLGYTAEASAAALTQSYGVFQRAASQQEPAYRVRGILTDGFDSTTSSRRALFPGARLGTCLRHALLKLPKKLVAIASPVRKTLRTQFHTLLHREPPLAAPAASRPQQDGCRCGSCRQAAQRETVAHALAHAEAPRRGWLPGVLRRGGRHTTQWDVLGGPGVPTGRTGSW